MSAAPSLLPPPLAGMRPVALLLDFDGVIVDSVAIKIDGYLKVYADEDRNKLDAVFEHQRTHGGVTRRVKFRHFETEVFGRPVTDERIEALSAAYTGAVHEAVLACPYVAGAEELIRRAQGHAGLHVVSGTPQDELDDIVLRRGLASCFASWHGAPMTKLEAFGMICARHGYVRQRVLAIGDAVTEFTAAHQLGIAFLGVQPAGGPATFPPGVPVVPSLEGIAAALGFA